MAANAETVQGFEFDTVVGLDDAAEPRRGLAVGRQGIIGIGLMGGIVKTRQKDPS